MTDKDLGQTIGLVRTITSEIGIRAPIEEVWATLLNFSGYESWNPYMSRVEGKAIPGTTIEVHTRSALDGTRRVSRVDVVSASPYRMHWRGGADDPREFLGDHFFELVETGNFDTVLRHFEHFSGTRLSDFGPAHEAAVQHNFEQFNKGLKAYCEARG